MAADETTKAPAAATRSWPEPQPTDGPDYHAEHAYWMENSANSPRNIARAETAANEFGSGLGPSAGGEPEVSGLPATGRSAQL